MKTIKKTIYQIKVQKSKARLQFICLFGGFRPTWEFFTHIETSPLKNFYNLTYARHLYLCPLSSEGTLAFDTYCDTGHPFIIISEGP